MCEKGMIELKILPDKNLIPTAVAAIQEYAKLYFGSRKDINNIGLSLEEAISNITEFFMGNRSSYIEISARGENGQFIMTVSDSELPGDIDTLLKDEERIGLSVMESLMDQVIIENLGRTGRRQTLIKNYSSIPKIQEISDESIESEGSKHTYEIRPPKKEEMIEIVRLLYNEYGNTYDVEGAYFPELQWNRIQNDDAYFLIAVAENGEIASTFALTRMSDLPGIWDLCQAATKPKYRKGGLMKRLSQELIDYAISRPDISGIYTEATVLHPYTQLSVNHYGFVPTGFTLSVLPSDLFQGKAGTHEGRGSFAIGMRLLKDKAKTIFVKNEYRGFVSDICKNLGIERNIISDNAHIEHERTVSTEEYAKLIEVGYTHVLEIGTDYKKVFRRIDNEVRRKRGLTSEIYVPLDDPASAMLMDELLRSEYFPVRYLPCPEGPDFLVFTKMYSDPVNYDEIVTVEPYSSMLTLVKNFDPSYR